MYVQHSYKTLTGSYLCLYNFFFFLGKHCCRSFPTFSRWWENASFFREKFEKESIVIIYKLSLLYHAFWYFIRVYLSRRRLYTYRVERVMEFDAAYRYSFACFAQVGSLLCDVMIGTIQVGMLKFGLSYFSSQPLALEFRHIAVQNGFCISESNWKLNSTTS